MKSYKQIMEDKDIRSALEFLLVRTTTVQQYNIIHMLIEKWESEVEENDRRYERSS